MWKNFTVISSVSYFTNGNPYSTCSQGVECSAVHIQDILCHIDWTLIKMPVTGIFVHKWTPILFSYKRCWLLRAYLCLNGCSELGGGVGGEHEQWVRMIACPVWGPWNLSFGGFSLTESIKLLKQERCWLSCNSLSTPCVLSFIHMLVCGQKNPLRAQEKL